MDIILAGVIVLGLYQALLRWQPTFLCKMFGHQSPSRGWWGDGLYGRVTGGAIDGIGRSHFQVMLQCDRCKQHYVAARFHGERVS